MFQGANTEAFAQSDDGKHYWLWGMRLRFTKKLPQGRFLLVYGRMKE